MQDASLTLAGLIVAETGLPSTGILVFVYRADVIDPTVIAGPEGTPVWVHPDEFAQIDMLPDLPELVMLTRSESGFFYMYKTPQPDGSEHIRTRLVDDH